MILCCLDCGYRTKNVPGAMIGRQVIDDGGYLLNDGYECPKGHRGNFQFFDEDLPEEVLADEPTVVFITSSSNGAGVL